ncbi:MAG: leucine-rich repeat domain-containing protein, partial [Bacteroidales bacterium]|nr:leucine-rich repeat domain-containing protein [Bacteroidales bacterium]
MKKLVLFLTCLWAATTSLWADNYDFSAVCETGQTLYYAYNDGVGGESVCVVLEDLMGGYTVAPTGNLVIPSSVSDGNYTYAVTSIGMGAFFNCGELTSVTIPNSVTSIGEYAFYQCEGLTSVTIPNSVTSIGEHAFEECQSLSSITIPNSVTSIGGFAFSECTSLSSAILGNGLTSISENMFTYCAGLTSVVIPNSVTSIGLYAFSSCSSLATVICNATTPPSVSNNTFSAYTATLYVPSGSVTDYGNADYWKNFSS